MRHQTALMCAVIVASIAALNPLAAQQDSVMRAVDRVFDAWRDTHGPGCAVGIGRNGTVLLERGYGMANLETDTPITPSSIFHVASVSKQFTAMAIMLLEKDGKLSVNDDIRKYVSEIPDYGTPITIRHLLTHTSGLRDQWTSSASHAGDSRRIASPKPTSWIFFQDRRRSTSSPVRNMCTATRASRCSA